MSSAGNPNFDHMDIGKDSEVHFKVLTSKDPKRCDEDSTILESKIAPEDSESGTLPESSNITASSLLRLPSELRLMVLEPLIADGDLNIMRTNKLMYEEAAGLLKKNGVFRMNLGYADRVSSTSFPLTECLSLTGKITIQPSPEIQHIEFHFNVNNNVFLAWARPFEGYTDLMKAFGGKGITRHSCLVHLHIGSAGWCPDRTRFTRDPVLQAITNLTGFKTLVFKMTNDWDTKTHRVVRFGVLERRTERDGTHQMLLNDYRNVRKALQITLGPAILHTSFWHHFLVFHPSDFKIGANTGTDSGV